MTPRFARGDGVRIDDRMEARHHRVPAYAKGCTGVIERICGEHDEPECIAYGKRAPRRLYRVQLRQVDLWGPGYAGRPGDTLDIEIFEHWLEPAR